MKKYLAIPVALLILLSGMNMNFAIHYCGGKIADSKISLTGKKAICGMESDNKTNSSTHDNFSSECCKDDLLVYSVEKTYSPLVFHLKEITWDVLQEFSIPKGLISDLLYNLFRNHANVSLPGTYSASAVSMANICVFLI
jgi:hypothetical protein